MVFNRGNANVPTASKAAALQKALTSAGIVRGKTGPDLPSQLFRENLYRVAINHHYPHYPS
jgi:hypothetical protein